MRPMTNRGPATSRSQGTCLPGVKKELKQILGEEITLPVVNWIVDENGQNAQMHIMGFANS